MSIGKVLDKISSFIIDPSNSNRSPSGRRIALAISILLGIGTLGIVHALSATWRKLRPVVKNETNEKANKVFKNVYPKQPNNVKGEGVKSPEGKFTFLEKVAQKVYEKRDILWNQANQEANGDTKQLLNLFMKKIEEELKANGSELSKISGESAALNILFQNAWLRFALVGYAKLHNLNELLNKHLIYMAQNIYDKREVFSNEAYKKDDHLPNQLAYLVLSISKLFEDEGRSLTEVVNNKKALEIFKKSNRLMMVLTLYIKMKEAEKKPETASNEPFNNEFEPKREAERVARRNVDGPALVTRLNLKGFQANEKQLKKGLMDFLRNNHPDKNPEGDPDLVRDANELLNMLRDGVYGDYNKALEMYRNPKR
jgi:hypothetical protein